MPIYGTALLAACLLAGVAIGKLIGALLGVDADIGGEGAERVAGVAGAAAGEFGLEQDTETAGLGAGL